MVFSLPSLLSEDIENLALTPSAAARKTGFSHHAVLRWLRAEHVPRARALKRFIEVLGLDESRYSEFLKETEVILICAACGKRRPLPASRLAEVGRKARGRAELRRRADGTYERPCQDCCRREKGRRLAERTNSKRLIRMIGRAKLELAKLGNEKEGKLRKQAMLAAMGDSQTFTDNRKRFKSQVRGPQTDQHRRARARSRVALLRLTKPFHLCPLCELLSWEQKWHLVCLHTWQRFARIRIDKGWNQILPPPSHQAGRGPNPERNLMRNYCWLIERRLNVKHRRSLLGRDSRRPRDPSTVAKAVASWIRLLPGSWDLVFRRPRNTRRANWVRQEHIPLPLELHYMIEAGQRDGLIGRLHRFGMAEDDIALLTGATVYRVRRVVVRQESAPAAEFSPQG